MPKSYDLTLLSKEPLSSPLAVPNPLPTPSVSPTSAPSLGSFQDTFHIFVLELLQVCQRVLISSLPSSSACQSVQSKMYYAYKV